MASAQSIARRRLKDGHMARLAQRIERCNFSCPQGLLQLNENWMELFTLLKMGQEIWAEEYQEKENTEI